MNIGEIDNFIKKHGLEAGKTLDHRYRIIDAVGSGGMSVVLKAEDIVMSRVVAIKVLSDEYSGDEEAVRRFVNESRAVAILSHPNIVNIYDVKLDSSLKYIVMEYIDGVTLKDVMQKKGKLSWKESIFFADQILMALEHAHDKKIVHRDIKPQNVMVLKDGHIKVADFGIAKLPNSDTVSLTDKAIGTVYYMSPEQACGKPTGVASDIYSLGVMMYEMTTGELPFDSESPMTIARMQVETKPRAPRGVEPSIPRGLEQIILKAMEKDPEDRFRSARAMRRVLQILKNHPAVVFAEKSGEAPTASPAPEKTDDPGRIKIYHGPVNGGDTKPRTETPAQDRPARERDTRMNERPKTRRTPPARRENKEGEKKKKTVRLFPIILAVTAAVLIVCAVGGAIVLSTVFSDITDSSKEYDIPSFIGDEYGDDLITNAARHQLIVLEPDYEFSQTVPKGCVIAQYPEPGKKKSNELKLTVSSGDELEIPDVKGLSAVEAEVKLRNMGFSPRAVKVSGQDEPDGTASGTEPAAGDMLSVGSEVIVLVSSGGPAKMVRVPSVTGSDLSDARRALTENGVVIVDVQYEDSEQPDGVVLAQSRAGGSEIQDDAVIVLTVSRHVEPKLPDLPPEEEKKAEEEFAQAEEELRRLMEEAQNRESGELTPLNGETESESGEGESGEQSEETPPEQSQPVSSGEEQPPEEE